MKAQVRSRLGRGLNSLISVSADPINESSPAPLPPVATTSPIVFAGSAEIPVADITANPSQPRRSFDDASLRQLAESLKTSGLIQPIIVRAVEGGYQLIAGERRLRAARLAGFLAIPAVIREVDHLTQAQLALVENIQREDLNPLERAQAYRSLLEQLGLTQSELAIRLGEERSTIANHVRLLDLAEPVRQAIQSRRLSLGHAKLLAGIDDLLEQQRLAELVIAQDLSVRNLERLLEGHQPVIRNRAAPSSAYIGELEKNLSRQLGMRCQVHRTGTKGRGRLVVHYASLDQFDQLLAKLGVVVD